MINIFVGRVGTGKTYSLVRLALHKIMKEKQDVYSNFYIDFSPYEKVKNEYNKYLHYWERVNDFVKIKRGIILIDEAQIYFNSRNWSALPPRVQYKFQQHRKHGLDIYGAVQNVKRVDTIIRELVNRVYQIKKVGRLFIVNQYDIEDIDRAKRKSIWTSAYFLNKKLADCYDTYAEIQPDL